MSGNPGAFGSQLASITPQERSCACRWRSGGYEEKFCGNTVFTHAFVQQSNTWLFCDKCYEGHCRYCKREGDG